MDQEKKIGGQIELVRYQAERVHYATERFARLLVPLEADELDSISRGLRACASEIENLKEMLSEYSGIQSQNAAADTQRAADV